MGSERSSAGVDDEHLRRVLTHHRRQRSPVAGERLELAVTGMLRPALHRRQVDQVPCARSTLVQPGFGHHTAPVADDQQVVPSAAASHDDAGGLRDRKVDALEESETDRLRHGRLPPQPLENERQVRGA